MYKIQPLLAFARTLEGVNDTYIAFPQGKHPMEIDFPREDSPTRLP